MEAADRSGGALDRIRRLRGVSWEWRPQAPVPGSEREAGVIAQDVEAALPELVETAPNGYLMVDYAGLAVKLVQAVTELEAKLEALERPALSDRRGKRRLDPVDDALARLGAGGDLGRAEQTALIGALVESVKELDGRLSELERGQPRRPG